MSVHFTWKHYGLTDKGKVRSINEDAMLSRPDLLLSGLWVVADGMGGHDSGELASRTLVQKLGKMSASPDFELLVQSALNSVAETNAELYQAAHQGAQQRVMGTTLVALALHASGRGVCLWAGDSRLYLLRAGRLERITKDHSHVQWLVDYGLISDEQARNHPNASVITKAIGADPEIQIDRADFSIVDGDTLLLCSDGITKELDDDEISVFLQDGSPQTAVEQLIAAAMERGGRDNSTAVCVHVSAWRDDADADDTRPMPSWS